MGTVSNAFTFQKNPGDAGEMLTEMFVGPGLLPSCNAYT
jgi:hypothetical protein